MEIPARDDNDTDFTPEFRVVVQGEINGGIHFAIHPITGYSEESLNFVCFGNKIIKMKE